MAEDRKLNWVQACEALGCKKTHFYWLVNTGRLPAYRYGMTRGIWVYESDCKDLLKKMAENGNFLFASSAGSAGSVTAR